jgi:16S rRNA (cytidine1402-2'-O)-methyltransferase
MTGTLFVVATPIGNLEDITLRALRVLREAHAIAAEDTRRTAKLLAHFAIHTRTLSFHDHNSRARLPQILARLEAGDHIALVSDAGTPSISDPGLDLVQACIARGITVDPIPGPSAPMAAAVASGFPLTPFTVFGFPPVRSKDRKQWLSDASGVPHTFSFFEAPHRVERTLDEASPIFGIRPIVVAREVTKIHQTFLRGSAASVLEQLGPPKGEFTVVVGPVERPEVEAVAPSDAELAAEFGCLTENEGVNRRQAVVQVAARHGLPAKAVYTAIERAKQKGE